MPDIFDELEQAERERALALDQAREDWARVLGKPEGRRVALRLLQDMYLASEIANEPALLALRNYGVLLLKEILLSHEPAGLEILRQLFGDAQPDGEAAEPEIVMAEDLA